MMQLWQLVVNDTPVNPREGLSLDDVIEHFRDQVEMSDPEDDDKIEVRVFKPADVLFGIDR